MKELQEHFFASANTTNGFVNHFPEIFSPEKLKRIEIIKGGPGTGKSGMMRRVARLALEKGHRVELFHCSSDPDSLDGVLIPDLDAALVDGTAPHTVDPKYPGAVEEIVYTGAFWDPEKLIRHKKEIVSLVRQKSAAYSRAYRYLGAAGVFLRTSREIALSALLSEKLDAAVERAVRPYAKSKKRGNNEIRLISSFSHNGYRQNGSFARPGERIHLVKGDSGTGTVFLDRLHAKLTECGIPHRYGHSSLYPDSVNFISLKNVPVTYVLEEDESAVKTLSEVKTIHMRRFLDAERLSEHRQKLRFLSRCSDRLLTEAQSEMEEARKSHLELEAYYVAAMDFKKLEKRVQKIAKDLGI